MLPYRIRRARARYLVSGAPTGTPRHSKLTPARSSLTCGLHHIMTTVPVCHSVIQTPLTRTWTWTKATGLSVLTTIFEPAEGAYFYPPRAAQAVAPTAVSDCPAASQSLPLMPTTPVPQHGAVTPAVTPASPAGTASEDKESNVAVTGLRLGTTGLLMIMSGILSALLSI